MSGVEDCPVDDEGLVVSARSCVPDLAATTELESDIPGDGPVVSDTKELKPPIMPESDAKLFEPDVEECPVEEGEKVGKSDTATDEAVPSVTTDELEPP